MSKRIILITVSVLLFLGCVSNVELNLSDENQQLVLNSILDTNKDTITVWLTRTRDITSNEAFESVKNAKIYLFEDGEELDTFIYADSSAYYLVYQPEAGKTYKITATVGTEEVWGETTVPSPLTVDFEKLSSIKGYNASFTDEAAEDNYYWYSAVGYDIRFDTSQQDTVVFIYENKHIACLMYSDFEYADEFNRYATQDEYDYHYEYDYYLRFSDADIDGQKIELSARPACISRPEVFLLSVDYNLDKYMKSSILADNAELNIEDFSILYYPQTIYSNINGGTGIVGSFTSASEKFYSN